MVTPYLHSKKMETELSHQDAKTMIGTVHASKYTRIIISWIMQAKLQNLKAHLKYEMDTLYSVVWFSQGIDGGKEKEDLKKPN